MPGASIFIPISGPELEQRLRDVGTPYPAASTFIPSPSRNGNKYRRRSCLPILF